MGSQRVGHDRATFTPSDFASKSRLLNPLPAPSFLPHWDSVREYSKEISQGVNLSLQSRSAMCSVLTPSWEGLGILPSLWASSKACLPRETLYHPPGEAPGRACGTPDPVRIGSDSHLLRSVCLDDSKEGWAGYRRGDKWGDPPQPPSTPIPLQADSLSSCRSLSGLSSWCRALWEME